MSKIVESLDKLQKEQGDANENAGSRDLFSSLGILLWLGASITATVFSYQLGVKQGLQTAKEESPKQWLSYFSEFPASASAVPAEVKTAAPKAVPAQVKAAAVTEAAPAEEVKAGFTIQVVTYASKKLAQEEVDRLNKKGHSAFVQPAGKYFLVCIDRFESKKTAMQKLIQLRSNGYYKTYPGAFVKLLKKA